MKEKIQIKAVDMVRCIRDEQAQILAGKSKPEIMAFFKSAGEAVRKKVKSRQSTQSQP
jgi:hypothetical protein